jgi:hypothetical protein
MSDDIHGAASIRVHGPATLDYLWPGYWDHPLDQSVEYVRADIVDAELDALRVEVAELREELEERSGPLKREIDRLRLKKAEHVDEIERLRAEVAELRRLHGIDRDGLLHIAGRIVRGEHVFENDDGNLDVTDQARDDALALRKLWASADPSQEPETKA